MAKRAVTAKWPCWKVERIAIEKLREDPRNPRTHSKEQVEQIIASIREFGFTMPILARPDGTVIAGHGRLEAAGLEGLREVPVIYARNWTDAQCRAYMIADNKLTENGSWDEAALAAELAALKGMDFQLAITGFSANELGSIFASWTPPSAGDEIASDDALVDGPDPDDAGGDDDERGTLLSRMDITIADPRHLVAKGDHYVLAGRHHLLCVGVMAEWQKWTHLLSAGSIFVPYPGPFAPFGERVDKHALVMVQPDPYTAGHILDRYEDAHGADAIELVERR